MQSSQHTPSTNSDAQTNDSLLIVGTGAMASLFAARLVAAGVRVTLLGTWPEGLESLRTHGVRLMESDGSELVYPVAATAEPDDCAGARFALVLVKSSQTERAAQQLAACLLPEGLALTLQNGLGNREKLVQVLGAQRVALGVTTAGATLVGPGHVRPGGEGPISVGAHPRLAPLLELLQRAGFAVDLVPEVDGLLWSKLVINAAINPLTALLRVPNGQLLARPAARALMAAAASEAAAVATAFGLRLTFQDPVAAAETVARRTAVNTSSMLQDVQRGATTEIDAICGAIVAAAEERGVPVPVNRTLWLLIRALAEEEN
ncbi:MAG TPA: 2-dehydropantoate 2-reductase [Anaerolineae bacterium]|nr:2-dehydropantoate 2-reductase [Anaerolineae bacterium]